MFLVRTVDIVSAHLLLVAVILVALVLAVTTAVVQALVASLMTVAAAMTVGVH